MASSIHNTRLLRFLIVVTIVVLTIFIYASYSSTQTLAPPPMRNPPPNVAGSLLAFSMTNNNHSGGGGGGSGSSINNEPSLAGASSSLVMDANNKVMAKINSAGLITHYANLPPAGGGSHGNEMVFVKKLTHHREPTIDENAVDDGGDQPGGGIGGGGGGINGGAGTSGGFGEDTVGDDTALEHFNNNNNDLLQEDQYVQSVDNTLGNINNSVTSAGAGTSGAVGDAKLSQQPSPDGGAVQQSQQQQQDDQIMRISSINNSNLNKIPESDVLIPTSNLQKFIESADKILKNITVQQQQQAPAPAAPSSVAIIDTLNKSPNKDDAPVDENALLDENDEALPPSVIMTIKGAGASSSTNNNQNANDSKPPSQPVASSPSVAAAGPHPAVKATPTTKKVPKVQSADPTQGIPTQQIYEPGHMNEEIDVDQICPNKGEKLKLLILITSAQTHAEARLAIRQTWGHFGSRRDVSTAFILGRTTNATINEALTQENMIYGDLIRGHFIDSYNNLTLKTLSSLEWVDHHCPKTKFLLKTDDDMFINVPKLLQYLDGHAKNKRVIYGRLAKKWKPIRNKKSKYYISTGQFSASIFPPFTTGPAYVMTSDIVHELYERSLHQVYLKLEDVFTTGIVAEQLGIKRVHVNEFLNRRIAFNPCNIRKSISVHMIKANEQFDLWKKLLDQTTKCK